MVFNLGKFKISKNSRPLLIAEISCNHCGSLEKAKKIILEAKKQGADLVKFQTYEASSMTVNSKRHILKFNKAYGKGKNCGIYTTKPKLLFLGKKNYLNMLRKLEF